MSEMIHQLSLLETQLSVLHEVSTQMMQENDLDRLLRQIADFACQQIGASYALVGVHEFNNGLVNCVTERQPHCRPLQTPACTYMTELETLIESAHPLRIDDIRQQADCPLTHAFFDLPTPFLGLPLFRGSELQGGIYLLGREGGGHFSMDDQRLLEILATYAAIGIANTRLSKEVARHDQLLRQRNESLSLLTKLATTMSDFSDIEDTLGKLLAHLLTYLHIDVGEVYLRQEEGWLLRLLFHVGDSEEILFGQKFIRYGDGPVGKTARTGKPQYDVLPDCHFCKHQVHEDSQTCQFEVSCYPLAGQNDVFGVLVVGTCQLQPLDQKEDDFLQAISAWLGVVLENQRLIESRQRLAVLEERERIGMDLHDGVIQSIYAVGLTLEHTRMIMKDDPQKGREVIDQAIRDLNSTIRDIRLYILDLRPRKLHEEDLTSGIMRLVNEFRVNALVNVNYQGPQEGTPELTQSQAVAMFHICQEALANVAKHARATHVGLNVWKTPDRVLMEIHDDGRGFTVNDARFTLGHGLSNMQTRANNAGGEVEITSARSSGTTILAWVPILNTEERAQDA
jgi:signal transduction histidine kinase